MAYLNPLLVNLFRLSLWLAILSVIFTPLERFFAVHAHRTLRKGMGVDLCYYFVNSLLPAAILSVPTALLASLVRHVLPDAVFTTMASLPFWIHALAVLVVGDIGYYWGHRWSHEIPFLWRFHTIHHSAEELDFMVNTRAHPLDMVFGRFCGLMVLYIVGLAGPTGDTGGSMLPVFYILVGALWGFFIHANLRWNFGPFQWLASTPMFHHWHHTRNGEIDHNYAALFPWIDLVFGTLHLPKRWPESYGVEAKTPESLVEQLAYPLLPPHAAMPQNSVEVAGAD